MFTDRVGAGRRLGQLLRGHAGDRPLVLGLPRGGVPVAVEVGRALDADVDVLVVRKIGAPWNPEFGFGAVGEEGVAVIDEQMARRVGVDVATLAQLRAHESQEVERRVRRYRAGRPALAVEGRTVILVDDGIATGSTLLAAVALLRQRHAGRIVAAAPVASESSVSALHRVADEVVVAEIPPYFRAVGGHFKVFDQVSDAEVVGALAAHRRSRGPQAEVEPVAGPVVDDGPGVGAGRSEPMPTLPTAREVDREVTIDTDRAHVYGHLAIPARAVGIVLFAHGSGSSRLSPRNVAVAHHLQQRGVGTLLFDLLTEEEAADRANVFDITKLAARLVAATRWLKAQGFAGQNGGAQVPFGYFGASTGAGAALVAAAMAPRGIAAVVSRGGRPDLAGPALSRVQAPTLLIIGGADTQVLELNRMARTQMRCPSDVVVVPGATHLFEEPGAMEQVETLAAQWFATHFSAWSARLAEAG